MSINTVTQHAHSVQSFDVILADFDRERCGADNTVVGGPRAHSGDVFVEHLREGGRCFLSVVCTAHLTYSMLFCGHEMENLDNIELEALTPEREIELRTEARRLGAVAY